uniref:Uncharacterized protein n=1 Tax=Malurus cyaneus samueli TaxID=2593467 RepID=A0A8C5TL36_9PASS
QDHEAPTIRPRRIQTRTSLHRLERTRSARRKAGTTGTKSVFFHQNVFPTSPWSTWRSRPCFLRNFSPDGATSSPSPPTRPHLCRGYEGGDPASGNDRGRHIRGAALDERSSCHGCTSHVLQGEVEHDRKSQPCSRMHCALVLWVLAAYLPSGHDPPFFEVIRNSESWTPNPRSRPATTPPSHRSTAHGQLCDTRTFKDANKVISRSRTNQGLYVQNIWAISRPSERSAAEDTQTRNGQPLQGALHQLLKHRLLVYLSAEGPSRMGVLCKKKVFQYFDQLERSRMWKMQLFGLDHLFIITSEGCGHAGVNEILPVMGSTRVGLPALVCLSLVLFPCGLWFKDTIVNAKYGEAHGGRAAWLLGQLAPHQCANAYPVAALPRRCPFSDYDDKWVFSLERPDLWYHPIRLLLFTVLTLGAVLLFIHPFLCVCRKFCLSAEIVARVSGPICALSGVSSAGRRNRSQLGNQGGLSVL